MAAGPRFRVAGIPVRIDPSFFLVVAIFGFGGGDLSLLVTWVVVVAISVLVHEVGHAFAFRHYGQEPQILLQGFGGLTSGSGGEPLTPRRDVLVSLAGPLTGLILLGLPSWWLLHNGGPYAPRTHSILRDVVFVNLAWSIVNLLPVLPLDGGRVAAAFWELRTGRADARPAHVLSVVVAGAGAAYSLAQGYLGGAMFAGFFAAYNLSQLAHSRNTGLGEQLVEGWRNLGQGRAPETEAAARRVLADRPSAQLIAAADELLAWSRLVQGDAPGARAALAKFPPALTPDPLLRAAIAIEANDEGEALDRLVEGYSAGRFGPATVGVADAVADAGLHVRLADRLLAADGDGKSGAVGMLAVHLQAAGRTDEAVTVGQRAVNAAAAAGGRGAGPGGAASPGRVAYDLACAHARAQQGGASIGWLQRAADMGFADAGLLDTDPDLDNIRSDDRFRTLRDRLRPPA